MLTVLQTRLAFHLHAAKTSFETLCRKPFATFSTTVVIAITLALPSLFWVFTEDIQQLTHTWQSEGHISLYLKSSLSSSDEVKILTKVRANPGVNKATLKSAAAGLAELQAQEGMEDIMHYLPENPLPAVIDVIPTYDSSTPEKLQRLYQQLKALPAVEQAKLDMQWIARLHAMLGLAATIGHGLMMLLALAVVLIIGNTLRLAIQSRHEEIQILKLIGATDAYILRPFLYAGVWYGLIGSVLAICLVKIFMLSLVSAAKELATTYQMHYPFLGLTLRQDLLLICIAILLGWFGARVSVKRELASISPYN